MSRESRTSPDRSNRLWAGWLTVATCAPTRSRRTRAAGGQHDLEALQVLPQRVDPAYVDGVVRPRWLGVEHHGSADRVEWRVRVAQPQPAQPTGKIVRDGQRTDVPRDRPDVGHQVLGERGERDAGHVWSRRVGGAV